MQRHTSHRIRQKSQIPRRKRQRNQKERLYLRKKLRHSYQQRRRMSWESSLWKMLTSSGSLII
ncbi:unnamed protein product [Ixodes persulcatus]